MNNITYFIITTLIFLTVFITHEIIHYLLALIFKRKPTFSLSKLIFIHVNYKDGNELQNILISITPGLLLFLIGLFIEANNYYLLICKLAFLINILALLPGTSDFNVIYYSIKKIYIKRMRK